MNRRDFIKTSALAVALVATYRPKQRLPVFKELPFKERVLLRPNMNYAIQYSATVEHRGSSYDYAVLFDDDLTESEVIAKARPRALEAFRKLKSKDWHRV